MSEVRKVIRLFDSLRIEKNGRLIAEFTGRKQDALLAYLALPPRRPHRRADIAAALWPGKPVGDARSRLAETLYRLNADLDAVGMGESMVPGRHTLTLSRDIHTDVEQFEELARAAGNIEQSANTNLREQALALYGGGLLPLITGISRIDRERERLSALAAQLSTVLATTKAEPAIVSSRMAYGTEDAIRMGFVPGSQSRRDATPPQVANLESRVARQSLEFAERAEEELWGSDRRMWIDKLSKMDEQLVIAVGWAIEAGETDIAVRLTGALWRYWRETGQVDVGATRIEQALAMGPVQETAQYGKALHGAGALALVQGEFPHATARIQRALVIWQRLRDPERTARCLCNLGIIALRTRDYEQARRHFRDAGSEYEKLGLTRIAADVMKNAALVELADQRPDAADVFLKRRLSLLEGHNDPEAEAWTLVDLATADQQRAQWDQAAEHLQRAKYLFDEAASVRGMAFTLLSLGNLRLETNAVAEGRAELEAAGALYRRLNDPRGEGQTLRYLAKASQSDGDENQAQALYRQSMLLLRSAGDEASAAAVEEALAQQN